MKLLNKDWQREIKLEENTITTLIFENKKTYREYIEELQNMSLSIEGNFSLIDNTKKINFSKYVYVINNLFNLDTNNKKITTKIYEELLDISNNNYSLLVEQKTNLLLFFETLIQKSRYNITKAHDIDTLNLLKLGGFNIVFEGTFLEKISSFFETLVEMCGIKVIITIGLQTLFDEDELDMLYKEIMLKKIILINIESSFKYQKKYSYEKLYIFDKENCEV